MLNISIADLHCHPTMKPYGRSFPQKIAGIDPAFRNCIYHYSERPGVVHFLNRLLGLTAFSQSNIAALQKGGVGLIICSLYPFEKGFVPKGNDSLLELLATDGVNLATGIGMARIRHIQDIDSSYFEDLVNEYQFLTSLNNVVVTTGSSKTKYVLLKNFSQLSDEVNLGINTIFIGLSFEGMHSLYNSFLDIGKDTPYIRSYLKSNLNRVKNWEHRPVFITFAHHFYNGFCGHAASLTDFSVRLVTNQSYMLGAGINDLGKEMIGLLLSRLDGHRILIDIKHMSIEARKDYFKLLDEEYKGENIPIIVSHGAVCGRSEVYNIFLDAEINFSDAEIVKIGRSNGLFGIQLDERRIANSHEISLFKKILDRERSLSFAALLVWRQIEYIAILLDINQLPAWDTQCIGSDNDGIVNPIDGIWSSEDFSTLKTQLLVLANKFVAKPTYKMDMPGNLISGETIIDKFMSGNMIRFLETNFS